jgi:hypothetical protein
MPPTQAWRVLADTFHSLPQLVDANKLPINYGPEEAIDLYRNVPLSSRERSLLSFLLHVWNRYEFDFALSDLMFWDFDHQKAFSEWVGGQTLGQACRYF